MTNNRRVFIGRDHPFICFGQTGTIFPLAVIGKILLVCNYFAPDGSLLMHPVNEGDVFDGSGNYPDTMP